MFIGPGYIVTFHLKPHHEIDNAWMKVIHKPHYETHGTLHAAYIVMDEFVDQYFPELRPLKTSCSILIRAVRMSKFRTS